VSIDDEIDDARSRCDCLHRSTLPSEIVQVGPPARTSTVHTSLQCVVADLLRRASDARKYPRDMIEKKNVARHWIVVGFALVAAGAIENFVVLVSHGYLGQGAFRAYLQLFSIPFSSLAALCAWWLLSKIATLSESHPSLFRGAFIALMLQSIFLCVSYVNLLWIEFRFIQSSAGLWIDILGWVCSAVGFFLMAREFPRERLLDITE
jgi:hypothetical protein